MSRLLLLAFGWLAYAGLHSLLAALPVKVWAARRWPRLAPMYRLAFNGLAIVLLLPLIWASYSLPGEWLWRWTGGFAWLANGLALMSIAGFWLSAGSYDMTEFLGIRPWREQRRDAAEHEGFRISALHRHVRHPWYALGLVLIWTRDMNAPLLVSALAITIYFIAGSRLEEAKLIAAHGDAYRRYRQRVPALLPLPWKSLSKAEASELAPRSSGVD